MKTIIDAKEKMTEIINNSVVFCIKRQPTGPDDFGDETTVGLHLKRRGVNLGNASDADSPFGRYLGLHDDGYVVLATGLFNVSHIETFDSLEELKEDWQLD
jgi:hypothetical protein